MFGSLLIATETQGPSYKLLTIIAATFLSAFAFRGKILKKRSVLSFSGKKLLILLSEKFLQKIKTLRSMVFLEGITSRMFVIPVTNKTSLSNQVKT
jgi:hypothetical protein